MTAAGTHRLFASLAGFLEDLLSAPHQGDPDLHDLMARLLAVLRSDDPRSASVSSDLLSALFSVPLNGPTLGPADLCQGLVPDLHRALTSRGAVLRYPACAGAGPAALVLRGVAARFAAWMHAEFHEHGGGRSFGRALFRCSNPSCLRTVLRELFSLPDDLDLSALGPAVHSLAPEPAGESAPAFAQHQEPPAAASDAAAVTAHVLAHTPGLPPGGAFSGWPGSGMAAHTWASRMAGSVNPRSHLAPPHLVPPGPAGWAGAPGVHASLAGGEAGTSRLDAFFGLGAPPAVDVSAALSAMEAQQSPVTDAGLSWEGQHGDGGASEDGATEEESSDWGSETDVEESEEEDRADGHSACLTRGNRLAGWEVEMEDGTGLVVSDAMMMPPVDGCLDCPALHPCGDENGYRDPTDLLSADLSSPGPFPALLWSAPEVLLERDDQGPDDGIERTLGANDVQMEALYGQHAACDALEGGHSRLEEEARADGDWDGVWHDVAVGHGWSGDEDWEAAGVMEVDDGVADVRLVALEGVHAGLRLGAGGHDHGDAGLLRDADLFGDGYFGDASVLGDDDPFWRC